MNDFIERFLNSITMYRLLLYGLIGVLLVGLIVSAFGNFFFTPLQLLISVALLVGSCYSSNMLLASVFRAAPNAESSIITALILACIIPAPTTLFAGVITVIVGVVAMLSKYILVIKSRHVFNPAALAAIAVGLAGLTYADWWIGNVWLLPFTFILGALVNRKVKKPLLSLSFVVPVLIITLISGVTSEFGVLDALRTLFISGPIFFFAGVMLPEPLTLPTQPKMQMVYGALVGIAYATHWTAGPFYSTPELALLVGNLFAATLASAKPQLWFKSLTKISTSDYELVLTPSVPLTFQAGQYAELTVPHSKPDDRGNRRTFTIASSPTESDVRFGIKIPEHGSSFKHSLLSLTTESRLGLGSIGGSFTLPEDVATKLLFLAGGIGITPFRSMARAVTDTGQSRDVVLIHAVNTPDDAVFADQFSHMQRSVVVSGSAPADWKGRVGNITASLIQELVPDVLERTVYISGSPGFVDYTKTQLHELGVASNRIVTDYFAGY